MSICPMCEKRWSGWNSSALIVRGYFLSRQVKLTNMEARLLAALIKTDRTLSHEYLFDVLWGEDPDGGPDTADNALKVHISKARRKLAKFPIDIVNIFGRGYAAVNAKSLDGFPPLNVVAYVLLIPLLLSFPVLALAQAICVDSNVLGPGLLKQYGEHRVSAAMTAEEKLLERYENPTTGTWTLIVYPNGAKACVVAHGTGWYEKKVPADPEA